MSSLDTSWIVILVTKHGIGCILFTIPYDRKFKFVRVCSLNQNADNYIKQ